MIPNEPKEFTRRIWLPDGNIEFLGRNDHQVKIQAFRIKPREIENCLVKHRQIKEVVVIPGKNPGKEDTKYLTPFLVYWINLKNKTMKCLKTPYQ